MRSASVGHNAGNDLPSVSYWPEIDCHDFKSVSNVLLLTNVTAGLTGGAFTGALHQEIVYGSLVPLVHPLVDLID